MNRPGIASMSLSRPGLHSLLDKLRIASQAGFQGIELFIDDLDHLAETECKSDLEAAAQKVRSLCDSLGLTIICLQPFGFYEGLVDRAEHDRLVNEKLPLWFRLAHILQTDMIQVPANFLGPDPETGLPRTSGDLDLIVSDLQELADRGRAQNPPFRFVYEALCWSNHINTWEASWEVVRRVDRPNFGLCLDTFNIAGRVYADPARADGKTPNAEEDIKASIARLTAQNVDLAKVFYIQIVDGERLAAPLDESHPFHVAGQPVRMNWSRNARLFAFEQDRGGYLPVLDIAQAIFESLGFRGWVSLELFSRTLADPSPQTPVVHAQRGFESWKKLVKALQLEEPQHRL
ncbi:hypothetical protein ASPZODRAFT_128301 [Penicilliopsis zonata CBS 506.65]|uniref:Xylose isomerase-like TIM barrel domain-containing protein n=1 Tax=Penicilliopsis zonata CBS 506.65 TaxID=1073090 RepID=A0A1L9SRC5_9EURO|nr:hypothetical protein ASPZODRAFT_128301 [Penicilliopsis zonata CBS 506.65]OJJ49772.1 hypothetical protein ASPZODRAFT_128301 [Penicilliopsis zonata CBS 506.65]